MAEEINIGTKGRVTTQKRRAERPCVERKWQVLIWNRRARHFHKPDGWASGPIWYNSPAPTLGQHNREVFSDLLGFTAGDLVRLRQTAVI